MNITNQLGQLTELWCQLDFCERGIILSQPTNPSSRYDFIADINGKLYRIQCKTAHLETNNRISIRTISKNWSSGEIHNYLDEIDYFYTHWNNKGYLIPINLCSETNRQKFLRLGNSDDYSQQTKGALYGQDYELDLILKSLDNSLERITIESVEKRQNAISKRNSNKCKNCGKEISPNATLCKVCCVEENKAKNKPPREELKKLIRSLPFTKIGEKYGITDNAIRKWCDSYSLPRKKADINKINDSDWELI